MKLVSIILILSLFFVACGSSVPKVNSESEPIKKERSSTKTVVGIAAAVIVTGVVLYYFFHTSGVSPNPNKIGTD